MNTKHRTVVVTGAAGNLGRAVASAFAAQGANLVLIDLKREALAAAYGDENSEGKQRLFLATNLLEQEEVNQAVTAAMQRFGRIDVLCNLTGGFRMGDAVHESSDQNWDFLFNLNSRTLLHTSRAIVPHMLQAGGGKIINVGAFAAQKGQAQMGLYTAAKSVVIRLTESMAAELRTKNINVNCVLPTIIDTPENRAAMPNANPANWVAPEALADVVVFLASPRASYVNGAALTVDGGPHTKSYVSQLYVAQ
jgi:NAD(P)-dependent dehydrogenase (short-subunit alcohol dehydrogenase family)